MIYVDGVYIPFRGMKMCHMASDKTNPTEARKELDNMAIKCGLQTKWRQKSGTPYEHYDVSMSARAVAVAAGAIECNSRQIVKIAYAKREAGQ